MSRAVIGIISNLINDANHSFPGYPRVLINEDYPRSIEEAGAIPFLIAPTVRNEHLREQLALLDAVFLSGGQDVNPLYFGEQPHLLCGDPCPLRDEFELEVLRHAVELNLPIFGICRGLQILNVFFGGTLYQDLSLTGSSIRHNQETNPDLPVHDVEIEADSFLEKALGKRKIRVNSFHHQSIKTVAEKFRVVATAPDGIIEAIEARQGVFMAAVQWHPEMLSRRHEDAKNIFRYFVEEVGKRV